ncbi:chorismate-binding protein [Fulvivirga sp.]|uniref:chorismate-binding protein n=1 Tax=Fulvivirga sp. TaxID=1931237 RepID=UPI0032F00977
MIERTAEKYTLKNLRLEQALNAVLVYCETNNFSFAAWRSPKSEQIKLMIDFSAGTPIEQIELENLGEGFILSPFNISSKKLFLKNDILITWSEDASFEINNSDKAEDLLNYLKSEKEEGKAAASPDISIDSQSHVDYTDLVKKSISAIQDSVFTKVVPSRKFELKLNTKAKSGSYFLELSKLYANAFVSITYTPEFGQWMGATPELLISTDKHIFRTIALAGTQSYDENQPLSEVAWTQKEIEEQALVSRYIINCFKKIRLREFEEIGPKTVKAGNLIHLKTEYVVDMNETNFPELGSTMLHLLHPTSAVCGMPLETSYDFLKKNEGYDRELFSGFLGPINFNNKSHLYVNLRCMKIEDDKITLFAGAGVTEDSIPEKEWLETEMKMKTLLNVIAKN